MHKLPILSALFAAFACASTAVQAQTAGRPAEPEQRGTTIYTTQGAIASARASLSQRDRDFLKDAAEADRGEVQAATLALSRAVHPEVRQFAREMIDDHTRVTRQLQQMARSRGVVLPQQPSVLRRDQLRVLETQRGAEFERGYVRDFGIQAHLRAIDRYQTLLEESANIDLRDFARQVLPQLQQHLLWARHLQANLASAADGTPAGAASARSATRDMKDAHQDLAEAIQVVQRMKGDPGVTALLQRALGVFIMPDYGRAAFGVGVQGGQGMLVTRTGEGFSNPVFYRLAGVSVGAQAGMAAGELALILLTPEAVQAFRSGKQFSLNADAGLTISTYSRRAHASTGKVQDAVLWSGTRGAYAGVSLGLTDLVYDADANRAYYGRDGLDAATIIEGKVVSPYSNVLGMVLSV